ncbi:hypothetical protein H310_01971 [Aphanomyces invadans]|uniref:Uncharacterized protein n=1 Tax=Aphanomyces invadans TaxID=157072 RepID=A0A024UMF3_9STRA|nr:hypothetical protein H310_01971 [Aphanomyces invadans]ETW07459.1 hypothetical protein H310_01971 [Aphanomyces invadans]|eukprot:XP_008863552.1 hypothetical protein H310_01971 [Aphanomyces invadans]
MVRSVPEPNEQHRSSPMQTDWELLCHGQHVEISKLKMHISQLEKLLQPDDDDECGRLYHDHARTLKDPMPTRPSDRRLSTSSSIPFDDEDAKKWHERVVMERDMIDRALDLVARQKSDLRSRTQKMKSEKDAWRHEHTTGQSSVALKEMKRILDSNIASLNENVRQLHTTEQRLRARMDKVSHIDVMLRSRMLDPDCLSLSDEESSAMEFEDIESVLSTDDSTISDALHQLTDDWLNDVGTRLPRVDTFPVGIPPLGRSLPSVDVRQGERFWSYRAPLFAAAPTLTPGGLRQHQCALIYEKQIAKWVHGRQRIQRAAIQHAKWLTSLCDEVHMYSKIYDTRTLALDEPMHAIQLRPLHPAQDV